MDPSGELKAASEHIRHMSGRATPGPWSARHMVCGRQGYAEVNGIDDDGHMVAETMGRKDHPGRANTDAEHIALWDPPTATLVADLLDGMAAHWDQRPIGDLDIYLATPLCKLARHILGSKP